MQKRITVKLYKLILVCVILLFCLIIAKLSYVVLSEKVDGINLTSFANGRNTVENTLYANRGSIFDIKGNLLAQQVNSYTLIAYLDEKRTTDVNKPQHVVDKQMTAEKLSPFINTSVEDILKYLNKDAYQVEFGKNAKNLTEIQKKAIAELDLPGIDFISSSQRYYKMGQFASYIVGYAKNNKDGKIVGEMGVEKYLNDYLEGTDGKKTYQRDAYGYQIPNTPYLIEEAVPGMNVYLTIDNNIQIILENAITDLVDKKEFDFATLSIMDAKTGAIVGSASYPTFNPNDLNTLASYLNPLVAYQYEPGSTMKMYSFMAAMEEGIYDGNKTYKSGKIKVADVIISDFNKTGWGEISFDTGFIYSSNVASTNLSLELGSGKLREYYNKFGFGKKTGIELPGELAGQINFKYKSELANASFGQGITTTPIQNLQSLSFIANDGVMLKPYIVDKIVDDKGNIVLQNKRTELGTVIKKETASKMKDLMYGVVYNGLSSAYKANNVVLIGKTGTAQIASQKGGYMTGKYDTIKSFAGMFPKDDPKYIVYFSVKQLVGTAKDMGDVLSKAVEEVAKYANITTIESDLDASKIITLPNLVNENVERVLEYSKEKNIMPIVLGSGEVVTQQYPLKNQTLVAGNKLFIMTNSDEVLMPDINGWSASEVMTLSKLLGIKCVFEGYGYVQSYSILKDTKITKGMELIVNLKNQNT